ncbi:hypothetical protein ACFPRL_19585 [Pseudoclavibacter helvolus]
MPSSRPAYARSSPPAAADRHQPSHRASSPLTAQALLEADEVAVGVRHEKLADPDFALADPVPRLREGHELPQSRRGTRRAACIAERRSKHVLAELVLYSY